MRYVFHAKIADGKLTLNNRPHFLKVLQQFRGDVVLTLGRYRKPRSNAQLRYLWGVVYKVISEHTGLSREDLHEAFKQRYAAPRTIRLGKEDIKLSGSTKKMDTLDMIEFVDKIILWANENNIKIPLPGEAEDDGYQYE